MPFYWFENDVYCVASHLSTIFLSLTPLPLRHYCLALLTSIKHYPWPKHIGGPTTTPQAQQPGNTCWRRSTENLCARLCQSCSVCWLGWVVLRIYAREYIYKRLSIQYYANATLLMYNIWPPPSAQFLYIYCYSLLTVLVLLDIVTLGLLCLRCTEF